MPWFKVDDGFHGHPKVVMLSTSAVGLWLLAGTWSAQYLTDGKVPTGTVGRLGGSPADADELVDAGLWHAAPGGYQFHEWAEYQPTKAVVEAERSAARDRMAAVRAKRKGVLANAQADDGGSSPMVRPNADERSEGVRPNTSESDGERSGELRLTPTPSPSPSQPEPSKEGSGGPRKRGTRIPDPFVVTTEMREWAAGRAPLVQVDESTERFVNHWRAKAGKDATKLDWPATWRNWLLKDQDDRANRRGRLSPMERAAQTAAAGRRFAEAGREVGGQRVTTLELGA